MQVFQLNPVCFFLYMLLLYGLLIHSYWSAGFAHDKVGMTHQSLRVTIAPLLHAIYRLKYLCMLNHYFLFIATSMNS